MSVVEKIRQLQEDVARQERSRLEEAKKLRLAEEQAKRIKLTEEEKRSRFVVSVSSEIEQKSALLDCLQRIDKELLEGNVEKHQIAFIAETGRCVLAWGSNFQIFADGRVDGNDNFSSINIQIDPDNRTITINAQSRTTLKEKEWLNPQIIEQKLAEAYMNPRKNYYHDHSPYPENDWGGGR